MPLSRKYVFSERMLSHGFRGNSSPVHRNIVSTDFRLCCPYSRKKGLDKIGKKEALGENLQTARKFTGHNFGET
jgi:hypothetical protein